jgi:phage repressor protein C with HTH and peptisase S24 domain
MKISSGDRFRALLQEANIRSSDFAKLYNVKPQHVNNWYKRGIPSYRMDEIAGLLTVNSLWLRTGEGPQHPGRLHVTDQSGNIFEAREVHGIYTVIAESADVELPFYKETSTTPGSSKTQVIEVPGIRVRLPRSHLESLEVDPAQAICAPMTGNSMAEKIEDGSTLAIDRSLTQVVDGVIYALEHDGMLRVKYLYRLPGGALRLSSHNSAEYPDEVFSAEQIQTQNIHILGWVFWWSTHNKPRPPVLSS